MKATLKSVTFAEGHGILDYVHVVMKIRLMPSIAVRAVLRICRIPLVPDL